tara:strand:- start:7323 stop:8216 length:894 start_codon:yes stop_codon:yes gene_type:complete
MDAEFTPSIPAATDAPAIPKEHAGTIENVEILADGAAEARFPTQEEIKAQHDDAQASQPEHKYAGKYDNEEDLEKAYLEAQRKITELTQQAPAHTTTEVDMSIPATPSGFGKDIDQILNTVGLSGSDTAKTWLETGELSTDQYDAFSKAGFTRNVVDTFIAGQEAVVRNANDVQVNMRTKAIEMAGGEDSLQGLYGWAQRNYSEPEQQAMNIRLSDPQKWQGAMKEMMFDYGQETGTAGSVKLTQTTQAASQNVSGYTDTREVLAAFTEIRNKGFVDEVTKARLARTAPHLLEGVDV